MRNFLLVVILAVGVVVVSSLPRHTSSVAADTQQSTAVFDSDGKLKLPTGYRRWVFVGAPLTPDGLNNGKAGFPEYHHVYVEEKNLDVYLKTGSFPEGTVNRFKGGVAPRADVAQAQTQLDTTRVQDTDVTVQRAQFEHAIAILIGKPPAEFSLAPAPLNYQPPSIPIALPSELLQRRPDIAAAERRVAEANQQIGIARAAYFPTVTLGGTAGFSGAQGSNWFTWPSGFWAVGPALAETLFDAGRRRATSESARANYDATVATYRQTSLTAFQEVEDNVAALRILENETQQQQQAVASSQESLQLFTNRYKGGVDTYLQVISAQTIELANERNAIDILRRRLDASVLLIKALGGRWDISNLPTFGASSVRDY
jgi:NodT family efflux transporter outer membrane factor (OMF) lipoprotein